MPLDVHKSTIYIVTQDQLLRIRKQADLAGDTVYGEALRAVVLEVDRLTDLFASQQNCTCTYCGFVSVRGSRTAAEANEEVNQHIRECDKRPERKLLNALCSIVVPLGIDLESIQDGDVDALVTAIDERWKEVMALIPEVAPAGENA